MKSLLGSAFGAATIVTACSPSAEPGQQGLQPINGTVLSEDFTTRQFCQVDPADDEDTPSVPYCNSEENYSFLLQTAAGVKIAVEVYSSHVRSRTLETLIEIGDAVSVEQNENIVRGGGVLKNNVIHTVPERVSVHTRLPQVQSSR